MSFHLEVRRLFVKVCHILAVAAQRSLDNNVKYRGLLHLDPICDIGLLPEAQVNVRLVNPMERQPKDAITDVLDVIGPNTNDLLFFISPPSPVVPQ